MSVLSKAYQTFLKKFPILSQAVQAGGLMGTADLMAQLVVEKKSFQEYSFIRTAQFTSIGFIVVGPTLSVWYRTLAKQFGEGGPAVAIKKVACDQLCFAPCYLVVLLTSLGLVQRQPLASVRSKIERNYKDILINNYRLWPAVQIVNFCVVPLKYQVLLAQCVALFWNTYLSWKTRAEERIVQNN